MLKKIIALLCVFICIFQSIPVWADSDLVQDLFVDASSVQEENIGLEDAVGETPSVPETMEADRPQEEGEPIQREEQAEEETPNAEIPEEEAPNSEIPNGETPDGEIPDGETLDADAGEEELPLPAWEEFPYEEIEDALAGENAQEELPPAITPGDDFSMEDAEEILPQNYVIEAQEGEDIGPKADLALRMAGLAATDETPYTVTLPKGSYLLGTTLHIFSNTTLDCRGCTITCTMAESGNMILSGTNGAWAGEENYNESAKCGGYHGFRNIHILGGTWIGNSTNSSVIFRMGHATNVSWEGCTLKGCGGTHQAEVCAMDGFTVTNCTFRDYFGTPERHGREALQLDICPSTISFCYFYLDGVPNKNVTITNCLFSNVPRGVGTHTVLRGSYSSNMNISGNVFENVEKEAIACVNFTDSRIQNNQIKNCGAGILFTNGLDKNNKNYTTIFDGKVVVNDPIRHNLNSVINGNTIKTVNTDAMTAAKAEPYGITVHGVNRKKAGTCLDQGMIQAEDWSVQGVKVNYNTITTAGYGIVMENTQNCEIRENTIQGDLSGDKDYDGILSRKGSNQLKVVRNEIRDFTGNGTRIADQVNFKGHIKGNCFAGNQKYGLLITQKDLNLTISENTFAASGNASGICLKVSSKDGLTNITRNAFQCGAAGKAVVLKSGRYLVSKNKINGGKYGVYAQKGVRVNIYNIEKMKEVTKKIYAAGFQNSLNKMPVRNEIGLVSKKQKTVKASWKKCTGVSGIQFSYSQSPSFENAGRKNVASGSSATFTGLQRKKTYYFKARTYYLMDGVLIYGAYGKTASVKVK